jgi:asparagine synthase (glutamine-hydrolysing)
MSIIFGIRRGTHESATETELLEMSSATARYAPDGTHVQVSGRVGMGSQPFNTHSRSRFSSTPIQDDSGNTLVLDGRLDNFLDLQRALSLTASVASDAVIILAAFSRWKERCFAKFIGEWALALWSASDERIYLARDHAGTRTLYFSHHDGRFLWSTHLETILSRIKSPKVETDYLRRYLVSQPLGSLTPYQGVHTVVPGQYVIARENQISKAFHWVCSEREPIRYASDAEYVDAFLSVLEPAVARRIGPGAPIVAHLSGGMDSSSIVCISDRIRRSLDPSAGLLATVSFYDDSEPSWNERPYFSVVEAQRQKIGIHIPISFSDQTFLPAVGDYGSYLLPGADSSCIKRESTVNAALDSGRYRVILAGIGGDEVLGGNPDPFPELASLVMSGDWPALFRKAVDWSLLRRTTALKLLLRTLSFTTSLYHHPSTAYPTPMPPWVLGASRLYRDTNSEITNLSGKYYRSPNDICNRITWQSVLETLSTLPPAFLSRYEYRYPLLDRDLVEYAFAIPRDQIVRAGRRRYLMRKALAGIVPSNVLERKRKAFVARSPLVSLRAARHAERPALRGALASEFGLIDRVQFTAATDQTLRGEDIKWLPALIRTIYVELWLHSFLTEVPTDQGEPVDRILHLNGGATGIRRSAVAC